MNYKVSIADKELHGYIFGSLSDAGNVLRILSDEEPIDWDGIEKLNIEKKEEKVYFVHPPYSYRLLKGWLAYGGWRVSIPSDREIPVFDTFREDDSKIIETLDEIGVEILIDSFHDNIEWKVYRKDNQSIEDIDLGCA